MWQGDVDYSWKRDGNWTHGTAAEDIHDEAYFEFVTTRQPTLDASYPIGRIYFYDSDWTVSSGGNYTLTLDSTYNGNLAIYSGANGNSGTNILNANIQFNQAGQNVEVNNGHTLELGSLSGSTGFTKTGGGLLIFTGQNSGYSGATTISTGTLQVGDGGTTGTLGSGNVTNNASLVFNRSDTYTVGNTISGTGSVTKDGSGTLILTGNNGYGPTVINSGTLQIGNGGATGNLGSGDVTNNATLVFDRSNGYTVGNNISGTGSVRQEGSGTVTLSGANTYTGLTTITAGTLAYGIDNAIYTGGVTVNGSSAVLSLGSYNDSVGTVTVDGGGQITGSGTLTSTAGFEMKSGSVSANLAGGVDLNKTTSGTVTLSGANTYTGTTTISAGTLQLAGGDNRLSTAGAITAAGGTFDLGGHNQTTSGAVSFQGGTVQNGTLTKSGAAYDARSGIIRAVLAGGVDLNKTTSGTVTLSGANTYTGTTSVNAGTLLANNTSGSATGTGAVTVMAGATLGGSGSIQGMTTLENNAILSPGNSPGTLTLSGGLIAGAFDYRWEILQVGGTGGTGSGSDPGKPSWDQVKIGGDLTLGSTSTVRIYLISLSSGQGKPDLKDSYTLFDVAGTTTGFNSQNWQIDYGLTGWHDWRVEQIGQDIVLDTKPVPIPPTALLFAPGLAGILILRRRRR
jgi:fibronectin-binding autotransporter adhesin